MRRTLAPIFFGLLLGACVAAGVKVDQAKVAQFERGKTTYQEVVSALGRPSSTTALSTGVRFANYTYLESRARPSTFIPYIGPFVGGADSSTSSVTFQFDANGVLVSYTTTESQMGAGMGFAAGAGAGSDHVEGQPGSNGKTP